MRIEQNTAGIYRIGPHAPQPGAPTPSAAPPPNASPARPESIDTVEIASISLASARAQAPRETQIRARLDALVGGRVNQPISFDPPPARSPNALLDRTYFRRSADYASINSAAVDRRIDELA